MNGESDEELLSISALNKFKTPVASPNKLLNRNMRVTR